MKQRTIDHSRIIETYLGPLNMPGWIGTAMKTIGVVVLLIALVEAVFILSLCSRLFGLIE